MSTKKKQYRQGDVLLQYVDSLPSKSKPVLRRAGRLVLADGNSGHTHYIEDPGTDMVEASDGARFLAVKGEAIKGEFTVVEKSALHVRVLHPNLGEIAFAPGDAVPAKRNKIAIVNGFFALLRHDANPTEHHTIALPRGVAALIEQSEYNQEEVRRVTD